MNNGFQTVPLGDILIRDEEWIDLQPEEHYKQVTVRLWGKGVVQRDYVSGSEIAAARRMVVKSRQFILSKIDARNGAFGLVPDFLNGAVVSSDFPVYTLNSSQVLPEFLDWMSKTHGFIDLCKNASEGTTNRIRLKEEKFLAAEIPLPPLEEQQRIVARIEELAGRIEEARGLHTQIMTDGYKILLGEYSKLVKNVEELPMADVAPLIRRPVHVDPVAQYHELGVRSFGKGTFHKPAVSGASLGTKRIFSIEADDLLFNIVFAWEGAVAVAKKEDHGRVGSHRFLTCVPRKDIVTASFLCFHFLTEQGLEQLGKASPGSAGRNRTLGIEALERIKVPTPAIEKQLWFDLLQTKLASLKQLQSASSAELDALLPSILDKAFKGEL